MRRANLWILFAGLLAGCSGAREAPQVQTLDAWCRPVPAGVLTAACYLTLTASTDDRLVTVSTPAAERVDIHGTIMDDDIIKMVERGEGLPLPRNQAVALRSGGDHLMLIGPKGAFTEGQTIPLTLTYASAPQATIKARIARTAAGQATTN
jgi:copper(I)-binding protein